MQSAFSAGPLHASLPAITAAEPLAGMTLGVLVFGDIVHVTPWLLALQAAGIAAMVAGTVLVARAPMFVKLTLQPAGDRHLPKLHVAVGPPLDDDVDGGHAGPGPTVSQDGQAAPGAGAVRDVTPEPEPVRAERSTDRPAPRGRTCRAGQPACSWRRG